MVIIYLFHYDRVTQAARKLGLTTKPGLATIPRRQNQSSDTQSNNLNECINRQCFHCIMHLPQYLSSANTSARWSGGRLRLDGAALGPAEGLLGSESFRNLNLPSSASRWRHHSSCGKGRSVHFGRKSPFFPPLFSPNARVYFWINLPQLHTVTWILTVSHLRIMTVSPKRRIWVLWS